MSDQRENNELAFQFTKLVFSNQKWKESDHNRDFSPEFQPVRQETKSENRSDNTKRNKLLINASNLNSSPKSHPVDQQEPKEIKERKSKI